MRQLRPAGPLGWARQPDPGPPRRHACGPARDPGDYLSGQSRDRMVPPARSVGARPASQASTPAIPASAPCAANPKCASCPGPWPASPITLIGMGRMTTSAESPRMPIGPRSGATDLAVALTNEMRRPAAYRHMCGADAHPPGVAESSGRTPMRASRPDPVVCSVTQSRANGPNHAGCSAHSHQRLGIDRQWLSGGKAAVLLVPECNGVLTVLPA